MASGDGGRLARRPLPPGPRETTRAQPPDSRRPPDTARPRNQDSRRARDTSGRHTGRSAAATSEGLSGLTAVALLVVLAAVGALLDLLTGTGLRALYGLGFVAGCTLSAVLVRLTDKLWVIFAPALVFSAIAVAGAVRTSQDLDRQTISIDTVSETVLRLIDPGKAPYLLAGFALSLAVILVRMAMLRR